MLPRAKKAKKRHIYYIKTYTIFQVISIVLLSKYVYIYIKSDSKDIYLVIVDFYFK